MRNNDWIKHTGSTCPVPPDTRVDVIIMGFVLHDERADCYDWSALEYAPITHYRISD